MSISTPDPMDFPDHVPADPVERFRRIYHELNAHHTRWWVDAAWMRFAAQAAVLAPGDPITVAERIRAIADGLKQHAHWWDTMRSPLRFAIAALEAQTGDDPIACERELQRVRDMYRTEHVHHGGIYEIMSIVLLRLGTRGQPVPVERVQKLRDIYRELKRNHWWVTGPHDLPACAVLVDDPGTPEEIGRLVDDLYQGLRREGFWPSVNLETAAHILPLAQVPPTVAIDRCRDLLERFTTAGDHLGPIGYDAIAVMALLQVPADRIVTTALAVREDLRSIHPVLHDQVQLDLTADLTFLSLIEEDPRMSDRSPDVRRRVIASGQQAAAIIACFDATARDPSTY